MNILFRQARTRQKLARPFATTVDTFKDDIFTISIIGRPNVGKSTLFNKFMGKRLALVDQTPGLTRDRREGVFHDVFDVPIRVIDTAGFETTKDDDKLLKRRNLNKLLITEMLKQTRNALIYSDLALFVLDTREGITYNDIALFNWLYLHQMQLKSEQEIVHERQVTKEIREQEGPTMEDFEEKILVPNLIMTSSLKMEENEQTQLDPLE